MFKAFSFALASALVLAGCHSGSESLGTTSSSGSGGTGGNASSSAATGGAGGCAAASISIEGDGPTNHFGQACMGSYGIGYTTHANGYLGYPGPPQPGMPEQLFVSGCAESAAPMSGSLSIMAPQTMVGTAMMGTATYANGTDTFTTDTAVTLTVTAIDSVAVKGSYTATVSSTNNGDKMLSGTFVVCRVPDFLPP